MNSQVFSSPISRTPVTDTVNEAGGTAYSMEPKEALAVFATTSTLHDTYYTAAQDQLEQVIKLLEQVSLEYAAKTAIYAHERGKMKDLPVVILAWLSTKKTPYFHLAFDRVITSVNQLRNFVKVIRSNALGRKSLGSAPSKAINRFFAKMSPEALFYQSQGDSPSLADVIRLAHPKPATMQHSALFNYLLGHSDKAEYLPESVKAFEAFKKDLRLPVPSGVEFRRLTSLSLTDHHWQQLGETMTWNQLRMNLNNLHKHNVFNKNIGKYVNKILDQEKISRARILPMAMFQTVRSLNSDIPTAIQQAVETSIEFCLDTVPRFNGHTVILVDSSGSMSSAATGRQAHTQTNPITCVEAATLFAASMYKANPENVTVVSFDTRAQVQNFSDKKTIVELTKSFQNRGGGTNCACGLELLLARDIKVDNIVMISDNESWDQTRYDHTYHDGSLTTLAAFKALRKKNPSLKMVCWDIQPYSTTQAPTGNGILNVGGFSESVYEVIESFFSNKDSKAFVKAVESISL